MVIIKTLEEFANVPQTDLISYLEKKFSSMMEEYDCTMSEIGEVEIFDDLEELFQIHGNSTLNSFEVVEVVGEYLHLVHLVDDYYSIDMYILIERRCL